MNRLEVRDLVLSCERCSLNTCSDSPVPFSGASPAIGAVLGEAPGPDDGKSGRPFSGAPGDLLRSAMTEAGLNPDEWIWLNVVSCIPRQDSGRPRAPLKNEINACSENRRAQLRVADPSWVLLVGNVPLQVYRPDLSMKRAHGRPIQRGGKVLFPIIHPGAAIRNPAWIDTIKADLSLFAEMAQAEDWTLGPQTCVKCLATPEESETWHWDAEGIPYCGSHWRHTSG